jgi:hypothetical protein
MITSQSCANSCAEGLYATNSEAYRVFNAFKTPSPPLKKSDFLDCKPETKAAPLPQPVEGWYSEPEPWHVNGGVI